MTFAARVNRRLKAIVAPQLVECRGDREQFSSPMPARTFDRADVRTAARRFEIDEQQSPNAFLELGSALDLGESWRPIPRP